MGYKLGPDKRAHESFHILGVAHAFAGQVPLLAEMATMGQESLLRALGLHCELRAGARLQLLLTYVRPAGMLSVGATRNSAQRGERASSYTLGA